jgi:hypothetical protein
MTMNRRQALHSAAIATAAAVTGKALAAPQTSQSGKESTKRVVPVKNVVPNGAQPIHGNVLKVEVIDAVDITGGSSTIFRVAVRIRNTRKDRIRCSLAMFFDGDKLGQGQNIDLPEGQVDLWIFGTYGGDGRRSQQLAKLTAEARDIRIGG